MNKARLVQRFVRRPFFALLLNSRYCDFVDRVWPPRNLGCRGELLAERHLLRLGYYIVGNNNRGKLGEIDIIAVDCRTVVFVEVKTRASNAAGSAAEAVTDEKEKRLSKTAAQFVRHRNLEECSKRFDVIAIDFDGGQFSLKHFQNAFEYALDD